MQKKELKFTANFQEDFAHEVMEQDARTISELTPGFQLQVRPTQAEPVQGSTPAPIQAKTFLSMPMKKEKKE